MFAKDVAQTDRLIDGHAERGTFVVDQEYIYFVWCSCACKAFDKMNIPLIGNGYKKKSKKRTITGAYYSKAKGKGHICRATNLSQFQTNAIIEYIAGITI